MLNSVRVRVPPSPPTSYNVRNKMYKRVDILTLRSLKLSDIPERNINETHWLKVTEFQSVDQYLDCFVWLTTRRMLNIPYKGKMLSGLGNVCASWHLELPSNYSKDKLYEIEEHRYWNVPTWICVSYIGIGESEYVTTPSNSYHHYRMPKITEDLHLPPIPMFLVRFYFDFHMLV